MNAGDIFGMILKPISDAYAARQQRKAIEQTNNIELLKAQGERQAQLARDGLTADANWEMEFARQAATSWKDEYTLLVVSIPLWMCFIPGLDQYVNRGFLALDTTPLWYQVMVQVLFYATVGIRFWRRGQSDN